ncbi:hypothetical protein ACQKHG_22080, partial [Escherichia coli]|uniref:hypothetical protein n=1 Tax=Escherichia coli TaxID=562 RepID=UPI003D050CD7
ADRNRSHWSTSKTPSYTKSVSWHHHLKSVADKVVLIVCIRNVRVKYQQKARIMNTGYEA